MRSGKLRHRGEIQINEPLRDSFGQPIANWVTLNIVQMAIVGLTGREYLSRAGETAEATHRIEIRAFAGLNTKHRIKCNNRIFNVLYVSDLDQRGIEMHVIVKELV